MAARTLAIGDIHGSDVALDVLLSRVDPDRDDTVIVLGDVIDRGPGSRQATDRLLELSQACRLHFILGNHEEMLLDVLRGSASSEAWLQFGGAETLASYGGGLESIPREHIEFFQRGLDYWENASHIFVHGNLEPGVPLAQQSPEWLRWTHLTGLEFPHPSGKLVICGHTAQKSGQPALGEGWVCIDTWVYGDGCLTCLDVTNGLVYQARQDGRYRGGFSLDELG